MSLDRKTLHLASFAGVAKVFMVLGLVIAGVNFVFINLPQIIMMFAFVLIFFSVIVLSEKDLRDFREFIKKANKESH
jgi:type IV secretory pathway VirB3-like protein